MILLGNDALNKANLIITNLPAFFANKIDLEFLGTNLAGQTLAVTELGDLQINTKPLGQIALIGLSDLFNLTNFWAGAPRQTSVIGAAFNFTCMFPFYNPPLDDNSLHVGKDWLMTIQVTGFTNTKVASGTLSVYYKPAMFVQKYVNYITTQTRNVGTGIDSFVVERPNQATNIIVPATATVTDIQVRRSDGEEVANSTFTLLESELNMTYAVETFVSGFALVDMNPSGSQVERQSDSSQFKVNVTVAGTYRVITIGVFENDVTNQMRNATTAVVDNFFMGVARRLQEKGELGALRALAASADVTTGELVAATQS